MLAVVKFYSSTPPRLFYCSRSQVPQHLLLWVFYMTVFYVLVRPPPLSFFLLGSLSLDYYVTYFSTVEFQPAAVRVYHTPVWIKVLIHLTVPYSFSYPVVRGTPYLCSDWVHV